MKHAIKLIYNRIYAFIFLKFWTFCPRCHMYFGEQQGYHYHARMYNLSNKPQNFRYVCDHCWSQSSLHVIEKVANG